MNGSHGSSTRAQRDSGLVLTDVASPDFRPLAGKAKDVSAGAVLISVIGAVVIGLLVLWPRQYEQLSRHAV